MHRCICRAWQLTLVCQIAAALVHMMAPLSGQYERLRTRMHSTTISQTSSQIREIRSQLETDDDAALMMRALRGTGMNDDDRQLDGVAMQIVEMAASDAELPKRYEPDTLATYFRGRPGAVAQRVAQIVWTFLGLTMGLAWDAARGKLEETEEQRTAELRNVLVSLGPFFIKLGQALSIRPDVLSPRAMYSLQQLCDKVPSFDSKLGFGLICAELGVNSVNDVFSDITPEPVAAASLGQVYKAKLKTTGDVVAVKVQRPFVLETVSLDLYLTRELGKLLRQLPGGLGSKLDVVQLLDEFASRFYDELDYQVECENGERMRADMAVLPRVVIPKNYPDLTTRRVHVAEWVDGEKLSQSKAADVGDLVNLGVITYLTQLLETGFFHADPHPGNMLRTPDGRLVILDFGLVTVITDDQKYGMIEAIAHLIHRDYDQIGQDFVKLDFIPPGTDVEPIVPALSRVFDVALSGGGAKAINFNELAADLAEITFKFPFRIPPYFAVIIRAIGVLEGIALVADPDFAIVDEAWPYISRRLLTDPKPRMRAALKYTIYGKSRRFDIDRLVDMLQALEKFAAVKAIAEDAFASSDTITVPLLPPSSSLITQSEQPVTLAPATTTSDSAREALRFFFSKDGALFRDFVSDEIVASIDAAARALATDPRLRAATPSFGSRVDKALSKLAPPLNEDDRKSLANVRALFAFLFDASRAQHTPDPNRFIGRLALDDPSTRRQLATLLPLVYERTPELRAFAAQLVARLTERQVGRTFDALVDFLGPPRPVA